MSRSRVEVVGQGDFIPREWLRKEVLWAYLIAPYGVQLNGWLDQNVSARAQHDGNVSRRDLFSRQKDPEAQPMVFFNQGKNVAGIISSAVLFRAGVCSSRDGTYFNVLEAQATAIDKVLGSRQSDFGKILPEGEAYREAARLAKLAYAPDAPQFGSNRRLMAANRIMFALASEEARHWLSLSRQDDQGSLEPLLVPDGGTPRSAGPKVEAAQLMLHTILESEEYTRLTLLTEPARS